MTATPDLTPAAEAMRRVLSGVRDEQLGVATPCEGTSLGALISHVGGLTVVFTAAAAKDLGPMTSQPPAVGSEELDAGWRTDIPDRLVALARAWQDPGAWVGMTQAGGVDLPGEIAGSVALNEVVLHGWDVARASGQSYQCAPETLAAALEFTSAAYPADRVEQRAGLFGPAVGVPPDAPLLDRLVGLTGRDPSWSAG